MTEKRYKMVNTNLVDEDGLVYYLIQKDGRDICQLFGKHTAKAIVTELNSLHEENEQLKQTIDEVRSMDKEKDIEVEHINNIYKEFGFKGIIDYAKDKLQNYGAVRKVDDGLWLLATGGWSDHEHWITCLNDSVMSWKGHYRASTRGGGFYYIKKPYADIRVVLE